MQNRRDLNRIKQAIRKVLSEGMDSDFGGGVNGRPPGDMTRPVSNGTFNPNRSYYNGGDSSYASANNEPLIPTTRPGYEYRPQQYDAGNPGLPDGYPIPPIEGRVKQGSDGTWYVLSPGGYPLMFWNGHNWQYIRDDIGPIQPQ